MELSLSTLSQMTNDEENGSNASHSEVARPNLWRSANKYLSGDNDFAVESQNNGHLIIIFGRITHLL